MLSFFAGAFAAAGLGAALGPLIIHLLNRRRFRLVRWAAMDFLREALRKNRRMLQLRDFLLLALRTAFILLFAFALARPYISRSGSVLDPDQPVHAVLVVDNSLSMAYQKLDGTLLDEAKAKARDFIRKLPAGSRISVIPLCGSASGFALDAYRTREDALEALGRIEAADRSGSASRAADLALEACERVQDLPSKRVIFIGDQQRATWPAGSLSAQMQKLPELQVVQVAAEEPENAWVADFHAQDGIADLETPAEFLGTIRYEGKSRRAGVQVTLSIDGAAVQSQTVDLEPGQSREVRFAHRFEIPLEPGKPGFAAAALSIPPDRLPADDRRFLAVPVVSSLPVVFVDQHGDEEDPKSNRYGETFRLRRLLVPVTERGGGRSPIEIRLRRIDAVDRGILQDARLAVLAGVERPDPAVAVLRDFVRQGGRMVIACGGDFDSAAWNASAWLDGAGILPAPLEPEPVGSLPEETVGELKPFRIDPASLVHDYFALEQVSREEVEDLFGEPLFFKAIRMELEAPVLAKLVVDEERRISEERKTARELRSKLAGWAAGESKGALTAEERLRRAREIERQAEIEPSWVQWNRELRLEALSLEPADAARMSRPRALASFSNGVPFLVERRIGLGDVIFVSSGLQGSWNTILKTNAAILFDRLLRALIERTLPRRNLSTDVRFLLPVDPAERRARFALELPGGAEEPLAVDALGGDAYGLSLRELPARGIYRLTARQVEEPKPGEPAGKLWESPLAVNGPAEESDLRPLTGTDLDARLAGTSYRWTGPSEAIALEGARVQGQSFWRWLLLGALACLLAEIAILAWPAIRGGEREEVPA